MRKLFLFFISLYALPCFGQSPPGGYNAGGAATTGGGGGVSSVTATAPITSSGGANPNIACPTCAAMTVQTNTVNNATQNLINFQTSTVNGVGLTATPSNPSGGIEKFEITGASYTGNASTASALSGSPTQCIGSQFAQGIASNGNANCATPSGGGGGPTISTNGTNNLSQTLLNFQTSTTNSVGLTITPSNPSAGNEKFELTGGSYTGNSATSTALATTPTQCTGGQFATGIAASGNANCGTPAGSGNTTSTSLSTNVLPKANGPNSIINSTVTDNGTTVSTTEPFNATSVSAGTAPSSCGSTASGGACFTEATNTGFTAVATQDYMRADATLHAFVASLNGAAEVPIPLLAGDLGGTAASPTVVNLSNVTNGSLANGALANPSTTVLSTTCTLGSSCTPTAHNIGVPLQCSDTSGSGTAQSCSTSPTFTPALGDVIIYRTSTTNTGALTVNVNSSSAAAVQKWQGSALASGDLKSGNPILMTYDGTHWQVDTIGNAPSGGTATASYFGIGTFSKGSAVGVGSGNNIMLEALATPIAVQFGHILFNVGTLDASDNASFGIYDSSGNAVCTTTAAIYGTTGDKNVACSESCHTGSTCLLPAGKFYVMFTCAGTTLKVWSLQAGVEILYSNGTFATSSGGQVPQGAAAFTPPADSPGQLVGTSGTTQVALLP